MSAPRIVIGRFPRRGFTGIWLGAESHTVNAFGCPTITLTHHEWMVTAALIVATPRRLSREEMHHHLYGEREDGGPNDNGLDGFIYRARLKLRCTGLRLASVYMHGWVAEFPTPALVSYAGFDPGEKRRAA